VLEWSLDPEVMADAACVMAGRNLTPVEWSTYLGDDHPYTLICPDYPAGT